MFIFPLVDDQVFGVRSSRLSHDGQRCSWISSSCGGTIFVPMGFFVVSATSSPALDLGLTSDCLIRELDAVFSFESLAQVSPYW